MNLSQHWEQYINSIGPPMPKSTNSEEFPTSSSKIGVSGFLDLKPSKPEIQARYDAMQPSWEGIEATNKAIFTHDMFKNNNVTFTPNKTSKK